MFQYPSLGPAPVQNIVTDKDGYYSIEFTNIGMSGVREITNEFSRHGEIVKVQQSGGRNVVKKVTVSYRSSSPPSTPSRVTPTATTSVALTLSKNASN